MPALSMPLTVEVDGRHRELVVRLATPLPWRDVAPVVLHAAGLPRHAALYWGVGRVEPDWGVGSPPLVAGCLLRTHPMDDHPDRPPLSLAVVAGPDAGTSIALGTAPISVGRDRSCTLTLTDPQVSFRHALLRPTSRGLAVTDLGSTNGVFVDTEPAGDRPAGTGSTIRIGGTIVRIQLSREPAGTFRPTGTGYLVRDDPLPGMRDEMMTMPRGPGPAPRRRRRSIPVLSALLGAAVGCTLAIVFGSLLYLAFAALGPVTMLGTAIGDRIAGRRSYRAAMADHRRDTVRYEAALAELIASERARAWRQFPDVATLERRAAVGSDGLWARDRGGSEYLAVAVGYGSRPCRARPATGPTDTGETSAAVTVPDVPIVRTLHGVWQLAGESTRPLARWIVTQLVCLHAPSDVALVLLGAGADLRIASILPHTAEGIPADDPRDIVAVLDGPDAVASAAGRSLISAARADPAAAHLGLRIRPDGTVDLDEQPVPPATGSAREQDGTRRTAVLVLTDEDTGGHRSTDRPSHGPIDGCGIAPESFARICRGLAPLRDAPARRPGTVPPGPVPLSDLLGPLTPEAVAERWAEVRAPVAVLGATASGPATLDLDRDGPHLLIAGTTGAGKSELLRTLIASLAATCAPQALTFLLVDYKGGAAFGDIARLPHVVGTVTDLDPDLAGRALASLRAELTHRERMQASGGGPPPRLVIAIDEFATLAHQLPDFLTGLIDVAQRGRSLGLHLVLATQRPAGVVSPAMRSNISARICLRVTDPSDSVDVVGTADAARIPAGASGRALLRTGHGLTTLQTALSTAPLAPAVDVLRRDAASPRPPWPPADGRPGTGPSALDAIVTASTAASAGQPPPRRPWLPPLPTVITPDTAAADCLAEVDLPDQQRQESRRLPDGSLAVVGPARSGRSTALRRIAHLAAARGSELLVVDGAHALDGLRHLPQTSTYVSVAEPRLIRRLLTRLIDSGASDDGLPPRYLIVDHYDLVAAALDRIDPAVGSALLMEVITMSGGSVVLAAGGPPGLIHHRAAGSFSTVIELGGPAGASIAGRGRWGGDSCQVIDAPCLTRADVDRSGAHRPPLPSGRGRIVVRALPASVTYADLPAPMVGAVPWGIGGDAARPVAVDLAGAGGAIVVAGRRGSGVTNALVVLALGAARAGIPVLWAASAPVPEAGALGRGNSGVDFEGDGLRERLAAHRGPLLLIVDHDRRAVDHPAADIVERFCRVCGPGQMVAVGTRLEALARARRGYLHAALESKQGLLLGAETADGAPLDVTIPRHAGSPRPGRGWWADRGVAQEVQIAAAPRSSASTAM